MKIKIRKVAGDLSLTMGGYNLLDLIPKGIYRWIGLQGTELPTKNGKIREEQNEKV